MAAPLFGWELLVKSVESEIKSNEDVLLCFTHLVLISNNFQCIGLGESKVIDGTETKTEALPPGWSTSYAIRYVNQGRLYNLKATKVDGGITINLIRIDERTTSLIQFNSSAVASRSGTLSHMIPKYSDLIDQVKTQLIDKVVVSKNSRETSSQTESARAPQPVSPLYVDPALPGRAPRPAAVGVGEYDLNPFGRNPLAFPNPIPGGGGMLFEPPRGGQFPHVPNMGLPPGAVPPGARFDPFRPPDVDRFPRRSVNRPDNDEFMPPGYDDMFM